MCVRVVLFACVRMCACVRVVARARACVCVRARACERALPFGSEALSDGAVQCAYARTDEVSLGSGTPPDTEYEPSGIRGYE